MPVSFALKRVYAFEIVPRRTSEVDDPIAGGRVRTDHALRSSLESILDSTGRLQSTDVVFQFGPLTADRSNPVRDELLALTSGGRLESEQAAERLASRLASEMDNRSPVALLVILILEDDVAAPPATKIAILLLPHESVLQISRPTPTDLSLQVLQDTFSVTSYVRKAAIFRASRLSDMRSQFIKGKVIDQQITSGDASELWMRFLCVNLPVSPEVANIAFGKALKRAFDAADGPEREQVFAAMLRAKSGIVRRTSIARFSTEIPSRLHESYFYGLSQNGRSDVFDVRADLVATQFAIRIFTDADGVVLTAPTSMIGADKSVQLVEENGIKSISYSGVAVRDRLRASLTRTPSADELTIEQESSNGLEISQ